jgi:hypothetical protein
MSPYSLDIWWVMSGQWAMSINAPGIKNKNHIEM